MKQDEFISMIERYYQLKYDNTERAFLLSFFTDKNIDFKKLYELTITEHSKKWKSLPDIYLFSQLMRESDGKVEIKAENEWITLLKISSSYDVKLNNHITAFCVSGYGSWSRFCQERDENREWTHKNFIKRWVTAYRDGVNFSECEFSGDFSVLGYVHKNLQIREIGVPEIGFFKQPFCREIEEMADKVFKKID